MKVIDAHAHLGHFGGWANVSVTVEKMIADSVYGSFNKDRLVVDDLHADIFGQSAFNLRQALAYTRTDVGQHGLPLLGFADWNDTVNLRAGAESLFTANLYGKALLELIDLELHVCAVEHRIAALIRRVEIEIDARGKAVGPVVVGQPGDQMMIPQETRFIHEVHRDDVVGFSARDIPDVARLHGELLPFIAAQAAIALENARLFEQTLASEVRFRVGVVFGRNDLMLRLLLRRRSRYAGSGTAE
jgi:hypothetical protein